MEQIYIKTTEHLLIILRFVKLAQRNTDTTFNPF
jgi:hypothetical protein